MRCSAEIAGGPIEAHHNFNVSIASSFSCPAEIVGGPNHDKEGGNHPPSSNIFNRGDAFRF